MCSYDRSDGGTRHRGAVLSNSDGTTAGTSSGIGYASVAGAVTQATNKGTTVTCNTVTDDRVLIKRDPERAGVAPPPISRPGRRRTAPPAALHAKGSSET